ncbi:MAG: TfoX/Sxy family protein [Thermoanaerobaculia bacterium]
MAVDEVLASRVRRILSRRLDVEERRMFGGLAFLVRGHMCCGVVADRLMLRVGPDAYEKLLKMPHVREMDFTGRPMRGMVYVEPPGLSPDAKLREWIGRGVDFVLSLPAK